MLFAAFYLGSSEAKKRKKTPKYKKWIRDDLEHKPIEYTAENGYPDGKPWYLDDTFLNLLFASGIMFMIWLPNMLFRAPRPIPKRTVRGSDNELYKSA